MKQPQGGGGAGLRLDWMRCVCLGDTREYHCAIGFTRMSPF